MYDPKMVNLHRILKQGMRHLLLYVLIGDFLHKSTVFAFVDLICFAV